MSGWISSKLKVAETLLQQIDQQAAESLGKNEASRSDGDLNPVIPKKSGILPPLNDQLKKKKKTPPEKSDFFAKSRNDGNRKVDGVEVGVSPNVNPKSSLTDSDWTELLSAPGKTINGGNGGLSTVSGLSKDGKRQLRSGSNLLALERKRSQAIQNKSARKSDVVKGDILDGNQRSDSSDSTQTTVGVQGSKENLPIGSVVVDNVIPANDGGNEELSVPMKRLGPSYLNDESTPETQSASNPVSDLNVQVKIEEDRFHGSMLQGKKISGVSVTSSSRMTDSLSASDGESNSETDSDSTSDSEIEREREERRKRREQLLAEKAAAKAIEAIKDRENLVARLEGEKQSLEKMIDERAKQQVQEASELQMTMMETMEAVDLEKQKHNNTRMEALMKLAKLETTNAELAKSLATAQWNLEVEIRRVAELHKQIQLKGASYQDPTSKKNSHPSGSNLLTATRAVEFEHDILEAEHAFVTDKIGQLQDKAKTLETTIKVTRKEIESPTEVEVELKRRLHQLTDHLIQKQAQVEALSSEKAMLMFRIEAVSRSLDESKSSMKVADLESGPTWELKPLFQDRLQKGKNHFGSVVRQLDSIFFTGATFLRRNPPARIWSFVYLLCLHFWVLYILRSHTQVSYEDGSRSGAVISLENINNTGI